ncbi:MAG: glycosyltransferase family 39 protein [Burkholderiales bacterium]|nr:glycosyltransferase family 39 protein [Burkholderiales bacterium]
MPSTPTVLSLSRASWLLLALACAVHAALGASLCLSVDEAHYALYATHLDWSYFDHPPLVGWVQWPLVVLDAPTWLLRLVPELLWLGTALLVHGLAERLQTRAAPTAQAGQAGFWAIATLALAPLLHVLGIGLLPDTLLAFWSASLVWLTLDLMDDRTERRPDRWLALGVLLGLAGLSKYTAIFAAVAVALCLLWAHGLAVLRSPWPWLAVVVALLLVLPVAYWNHANHWISFTYQAQHGAGGGWQAVQVLRFALVQVLAYGPLLLWGWVGARRADAPILLLFFAVPFLVMAVLSGGGTSLPHWTAPAWVALAPLAGVGLASAWQLGHRRWILVLVVAQGLMSAILLGLMLTAGWPFVTGSTGQGNSAQPSNPFADLHGWDQAGATARALAVQHGLHSVAVQNWTLASRLGWYARPLPVHVLEDRFDQFDLWAGDLPAGGDTLLVDWSQLAYAVPLGPHGFAECTLLETQDAQRLGATIATFRFYACRNWSGQPQPRLQGTS